MMKSKNADMASFRILFSLVLVFSIFSYLAVATVINQSDNKSETILLNETFVTMEDFSTNVTINSTNETIENVTIELESNETIHLTTDNESDEEQNEPIIIASNISIEITATEKIKEIVEPVFETKVLSNIGKKVKLNSKNLVIKHDYSGENKEDKTLFDIVSSSDNHLLGEFEQTHEWAYKKAGSETVSSDNELVVIGNHICIVSDYLIDNAETLYESKTYTNCIYYPPQYVEKELTEDVELAQDDGTVLTLKAGSKAKQQVRKIEQISKKTVEVSFDDDYDPTITELQVGMVSYWTLDTDASDDYGSNDGSVTGADSVSAKIDDGYDFEASDTEDYISVSDDNSLDITDEISLSFWIDPESLGHGYIVSKYRAYMCQMEDSSGNVQCGIWYDNSGPSWLPMVEYEVGTEWSHIVFTYDKDAGGSQEAKMYVNGSLVDTGDYSYSIYTGSYDLGMGNRLTDYARDYDGVIDEVGIWNTVLDSDDVTELYNNGDGLQPLGSGNATPTTIWTKETGAGCNSSLQNSGWETVEFRLWIDNDNLDDSGNYEQVRFKFCAGTDEDLRVMNVSVCYTNDESPDPDTTCYDFTTSQGEGTSGDWYYSEIASGYCEWTPWMTYDWDGSKNHFVQWATLSGSYDGNRFQSDCSRDRLSRLLDTTAHVMNPSFTSDDFESYMYDIVEIQGSNGDAQSLSISFSGDTPDDDSVQQSIIIPVDVSITSNGSASGLIDFDNSLLGYWSFEDYDSNGVNDSSSYGTFGDFMGGASTSNIVTGKYGNAMDFDGSSDYLDVHDGTLWDFKTTDSITVEAWINLDSHTPSTYANIFGDQNGPCVQLHKYTTPTYRLIWYTSSEKQSSDLTFNLDTWYHIAVVKTSSSIKFYRNGALVSSTTPNEHDENPDNVRIGGDQGGEWFPGMMDEVRVYKRALSLDEIQASYDASVYTLSANFTGLSTGAHTFQAMAVDYDGNSASTEERTVTIGGDGTLTYDDNGNLVQGLNGYYEYNEFNQLVRVRASQGGTILEDYWYDYNGNRMKKEDYITDTTYYYIGNDFVRIVNSSGTFNSVYYYANGKMLAKNESGTMTYMHPDHVGSSNLITNSNGNEVETVEYYPFGAQISDSEEERGYEGKELDSTGLNYFGARYYDSELRMFTQPDPVIANLYNPQNLNRYSFELNNPYKYTDPDGKSVANPFEGIINAVKDAFNFGKSDAIVSEGQNLQNAYEDSNLKTAADMSGLSDAVDVIQWGTCELDKVGGSGAIAGSNDMSEVRSEGATASAFIFVGLVTAGGGDNVARAAIRGADNLPISSKNFIMNINQGATRIMSDERGLAPLLRIDRQAHHKMPANHLQYGKKLYTGRHGDEAYDILAEVYVNNPNIKIIQD